tara:strand:- start:1651 stop:1839 length:189 start_codon:yes stop_codon:yes gene_type:complete
MAISWRDISMYTRKVNRVEVIDFGDHYNSGLNRTYINLDCKSVGVDVQDDGQTLKIFLSSGK